MSDNTDMKAYRVESAPSEVGVDGATAEGKKANQAALKLARDLPEADSEADGRADATEITIRGVESDAEFVFEAWAWSEDADDDADDWMPSSVTKADVEPVSLDDPDEWFSVPAERERWEAEH